MSSYEIRLCKREGIASEVIRVRRVSDFAAIRNARAIAKAGDSVEVWRGSECIYTGANQVAPPLN
jgi:hypothetical protein